jgi:hypothetical protein
VGVVVGDEVDAALHEAGGEVDVAGQAVEPGDHERGARALGVGDGAGQLGAVDPLAALDLPVGREDRGVAGAGVGVDGGDLGVEADRAVFRLVVEDADREDGFDLVGRTLVRPDEAAG